MRMKAPTLVLTLFLTLCSLSQAQSDLDTAELSAVVSVCGGVVIILCLVWIAICVAHWRTERDICQFKKRLRQRREQYRTHHERQLQLRQYHQYQQRGRNRNQMQVVQPTTSPHLLAPQIDRRFKPTLISQSASMEFTNLPSRMTVHPADKHNQLHPSSNGQKQYLASERRPMQQPHPLSVNKNGAATSSHLQTPKTSPQPQVPTIAVDNDERTSSSLTNQVQPSTLEQVQETNSTRSPIGQQMHRTPQMPCAVLRPYSPMSLREVEEMDIELDSTNTPPRYSWLFPEKKERTSQSDQTSPYSFLTPASTRNSGRGRGKTVQDMAIYGQLTSWPQLA